MPGFNPVGKIGGLFTDVIRKTSVRGLSAGLGNLYGLVESNYLGAKQANKFGGPLTPAGQAYNAAKTVTGGPFSPLPAILGTPVSAGDGPTARQLLGKLGSDATKAVSNEGRYIYDRLRSNVSPYGPVDYRTNTGDYGKNAPPGSGKYFGTMTFTPEAGSNAPGSPAAERAYAAERSSVAQQAAQNPMLQQYQDLRTSDLAAAQDLGMRIWAEKHRGLAEKVKPGQSGYDVIQQALTGQAPKVSGVVSEPWNTGLPLSGTPAPIPGYSMQQSLGTEIPMDEETLARLRGVAFDPAQMFGYRPE